MGAGARWRRVRIEAPVIVEHDLGGDEVTGWTLHFICQAEVRFGTGNERRVAAMEGASAPATFRLLKSSETDSVTERFRILLDGVEWDIASIAPSPNGRAVDITATCRKA